MVTSFSFSPQQFPLPGRNGFVSATLVLPRAEERESSSTDLNRTSPPKEYCNSLHLISSFEIVHDVFYFFFLQSSGMTESVAATLERIKPPDFLFLTLQSRKRTMSRTQLLPLPIAPISTFLTLFLFIPAHDCRETVGKPNR